MKRIFSIAISLCLSLSLLYSEPVSAESNCVGTILEVPEITDSELDSNASSTKYTIQSYLDIAASNATEDEPYTIKIPAGIYKLNGPLHIYSNTILDLTNVTLTKAYNRIKKTNLLATGTYSSAANSGSSGYEVSNIVIKNGTLDGNDGIGTLAKVMHASNITFDNCIFTNAYDSHAMEVACVDGLNIYNCQFTDLELVKDGNPLTYEAIQLDITTRNHISNYRAEAASVKNVCISGCTFENVPRGVGSHTAVYNLPFENITISNNIFNNLSSSAIEATYWKNAIISNNTITNVPKGIQMNVFRSEGYGTYLASSLAEEGNVPTNISDNYIPETNYNIEISHNTINLCKNNDPYQTTVRVGIRLLGANITSTNNSFSDGSGGVPIADYYMCGANIHDNIIATTGYGIHIDNANSCSITSNTISFSGKNSGESTMYHDIFVKNKSKNLLINKNILNACEGNAISITDNSNASEISYNTISTPGKYGIAVYNKGASASTIKGNKISYAKSYGIHVYDGATVKTIDSNSIYKPAKYGINVANKNASVTTITNNTISTPGTTGIFVYNKGKVTTIKINKISSAGGSGIAINTNSTIGTIEYNTISKPKQFGIAVSTNSKATSINKNAISSPKKNGINVDASTISTISSNTISSAGNYGINVGSPNNKATKVTTISKNIIKTPVTAGINVYNKASVTNIISNIITTSKECGIKINSKAKVKKISQNSISSSKDSAITIGNSSAVTYIDSNTISTAKYYGIRVYSSSTVSYIRKNKISKAIKYGIVTTSKSKISSAAGNKISGSKKPTYADKSSKIPKKY